MAGKSRERGDFMDGIVESAMRSLIGQLKIEYQKELHKALEEVQAQAQLAQPVGFSNRPSPGNGGSPLRAAAQGQTEPLTVEDTAQDAAQHLPNMPEIDNVGTDSISSFRLDSKGKSEMPIRRLSDSEIDVLVNSRRELAAKEDRGKKKFGTHKQLSRTSLHVDVEGMPVLKRLACTIVTSRIFDFFMGAIIIVNAATIGVEASFTVEREKVPTSLIICEYIFLVIYMLEIALRFYATGVQTALQNNWVRFDFILVLSGILNFLLTVSNFAGETFSSFVGNANMLKMLRLARLARTVRVLVQFRTLWLLVQGLMYAVLPMLWTCIIMFVVVYIFAIAGMEVIMHASEDPEYVQVADNFSSITGSMLTLVQFITLDSMAAIYRPLIQNVPSLSLYFLTFFLLGPIALMNIVTAIMVESSLRTANDDVEAKKAWEKMKKTKMMPKLREIFQALDQDGNMEVDLQEIQDAPEEVKEQIMHIVDLEEIEEVFRMLDVDGSGSVSIDEFVDGIIRSQADKPSELIVLMKQGRTIIDMVQRQQAVQERRRSLRGRDLDYEQVPARGADAALADMDA